MPYIREDRRKEYAAEIGAVVEKLCRVSEKDAKGELNFIIFSLVRDYAHRTGMSYAKLNDIVGGVLTCCQIELYRRIVAPYEDRKIAENGDVLLSADRHGCSQSADCMSPSYDCVYFGHDGECPEDRCCDECKHGDDDHNGRPRA